MVQCEAIVNEFYLELSSSHVQDRHGDEAITILQRLLREKLYIPIADQVGRAINIRGKGRGILRQELKLTPARLSALLRGQKIEVTLERTIVALMDGTIGEWWNQFNPAAGVCSGNVQAADIIHSVDHDGRRILDFIEAKDWDADDEPLKVALQVLRYYLMFHACHARQISPYHEWPELALVRLWVLAPVAYIKRHRGLAEVNRTLGSVHRAIDGMRLLDLGLASLRFEPTAIVLDSSVTKDEFIGCFETAKVKKLIREGLSVSSPLNVLIDDKVEMLRGWMTRAFKAGGI